MAAPRPPGKKKRPQRPQNEKQPEHHGTPRQSLEHGTGRKTPTFEQAQKKKVSAFDDYPLAPAGRRPPGREIGNPLEIDPKATNDNAYGIPPYPTTELVRKMDS